MTAAPRPDRHLADQERLRLHLARSLEIPADRIGHIMIIMQVINPSEGADLMVCCDYMRENAAQALRVHADSIDRRALGDAN